MAKLKSKLRIRTRELRYIMEDVEPLQELLRTHGAPVEYVPGRPVTEITTVYLDSHAGTWSEGLSPTKLRVRSYQEPDQWWFELKRRVEDRVDKWRRPMTVAEVIESLDSDPRWKPIARAVGLESLRPVFAVRCHRTAYEWPGLRVTLDRGVTFHEVQPDQPLTLRDEIGRITGVVVEVKSEPNHPDWLGSAVDGHRIPGYSKSRYALALLRGLERPFLEPAARAPVELVAS